MVLVSKNLGTAPMCALMPRDIREAPVMVLGALSCGFSARLQTQYPELDHHIQMGMMKYKCQYTWANKQGIEGSSRGDQESWVGR